MRRLLPLVLLFASCATLNVPQETAAVNQAIDAWHLAAAHADEARYFGLMTPDAVFLGTDATERWDKAAFQAFAHPYFAKGTAWTFTPKSRHVMLDADGHTAWFDEALASDSYGECRGTGVLRREGGTWRIAHYNLTIPIPNSLAKDFVAKIRAEQH